MSRTYMRPSPVDEEWDAAADRELAADRYASLARRWDEVEDEDRGGGRRWLGRTAVLVAMAVALLGGAGYGAFKVMDGPARDSNTGVDAASGPAAPTDAAPTYPGERAVPPAEPSAGTGPVGSTSPTQAAPYPPTPSATANKPDAPKPPKPKPAAQPPGDEAAQVLAFTNTARAAKGCAPLTAEPHLAAAAQGHAADMAAQHYFDHTSKDGSSMAARVDRQGYRWSGVAENIAKGQRTAKDVVDGWMNSDGHRRNIENCGYKHLGVGLAREGGSLIWVQNFGSPR